MSLDIGVVEVVVVEMVVVEMGMMVEVVVEVDV